MLLSGNFGPDWVANCVSVVVSGDFCRFKLALPSLLFTSSTFITLVKSVQTSHKPTRAQSKKSILKAWNYITIDFHQEMGQEFSTIVQIIVKADRGKAIAWRSVSCKMTLLITRRKNSSWIEKTMTKTIHCFCTSFCFSQHFFPQV